MRKNEIAHKLDEIIDFSGVERYIDTPVKRYSSGMYVRLAFAVAAHLESEILIVDEVLAVGDAEFQKKCLGRLKDVSTNEGRTVLFVSHNLASLRNVCSTGLLLKNGHVFQRGAIDEVVSNYNVADSENHSDKFIPSGNSLRVVSFDLCFDLKLLQNESSFVDARFKLSIMSDGSFQNVAIGIGVNDIHGNRLITLYSHHMTQYFDFEKGLHHVECVVQNWPLRFGKYMLVFSLVSNGVTIDSSNQGVSFDYFIKDCYLFEYSNRMDDTQGSFVAKQNWIKL
jgi:lipopolysaccharide transport system ATP-binding protein